MRFRNGLIFCKEGRSFRDMIFIKIIRRNSSRTNGLVHFRYLGIGDSNIYKRRPQELKGFRVHNR